MFWRHRLGRRSLVGFVALIAGVNLPVVLSTLGILKLGDLAKFLLVFDLAFVLWFLLTFWGKKPLNPDDKSTD